MEFKDVIGVDVAKSTLDVVSYQHQNFAKFDNTPNGFSKLLKWICKITGLKTKQVLICFENTGMYSLELASYLSSKQLPFHMAVPLEVKRSSGLRRGKNDKTDAKMIAQYAWLRRTEIEPTKLAASSLQQLGRYLKMRQRLVVQRAGFKASLAEMKRVLKTAADKLLLKVQQDTIRHLDKQIDLIEAKMKQIINEDEELNQLYELITTVKGVGFVVGSYLLVYTKGFKAFDSWRKFACYSGTAPFDKQSGSSLKANRKVHHIAHKKMKSILDRAAMSSIVCDPEIKAYYHKRINSGKSKRSTINVVRNKIIARVFAVANRRTPFVNRHTWAA